VYLDFIFKDMMLSPEDLPLNLTLFSWSFLEFWSDHSGDELFAKVYAALDEINFFKTSPAGAEDPGQLSKATQYFNEAVLVRWAIVLLW
jgi:hypothetical protein